MRKIIVGEFLTLDGVMQAPGSSEEDATAGFKYGGWQLPYLDDEAGKILDESMAETYGLLLGRVTYQIFANYWPHAPAEDPNAKQMNGMHKFVVSTTLDKVEWINSTLIKQNVAQEIAKLKQQPGTGNLVVVGSGKLAQSLISYGLVDEYVLWIHHVVVGSGKRLFDNGIPRINLKLVDTKTTGTGIVVLSYVPERK